jgi:hypothetical protein
MSADSTAAAAEVAAAAAAEAATKRVSQCTVGPTWSEPTRLIMCSMSADSTAAAAAAAADSTAAAAADAAAQTSSSDVQCCIHQALQQVRQQAQQLLPTCLSIGQETTCVHCSSPRPLHQSVTTCAANYRWSTTHMHGLLSPVSLVQPH